MKKFSLLVCLLLTFMLHSFVNTNNNVYAKEISYDKWAYEDSDEIYILGNINERYRKNGKTYTIDDYENELLGSGTSIDNVTRTITILEDDPIVNIIPRDYFLYENQSYGNGDEYFYCINTHYYNGSNSICDTKKIFESHVIIADYESNVSSESIENNKDFNTMSLEVKVKQYTFYTITEEDNSSYGYYVGGNLRYFGKKINLPLSGDKKEVIVPNPSTDNYYEFYYASKSGYFHLENSYCQTTILNSHSESQNNGLFFISAYSMYDGKKEKIVNEYPSHEDLVELGSAIYDMVADDLFPQIAEVISNINMAFTIAKGVDTLFSLFSNDEVTENVEFNNEEALKKLELFYTNKDAQLQNYNQLIKSYVYAEPDLKLINNGQHVKYNFRYSYDSRDRLDSKIIQTIGFDLYYKGEYVDNFSNNIEKEVETDYTENISLDKVYTGYSLYKTKTTYAFVPQNTQIYNIELTDGYTFEVYDDKGNLIDINKDKLNCNNIYYIIVYANTTGTYKLKIDYPLINGGINLLNGDVAYLRFNAPTKDAYYIGNKGDSNITFGFIDGNGITDIKLLDKNETTLVKIINYNSEIKTFVPNIVEVSKSNVYSGYVVPYKGDYSINTNAKYYVYDGDSLKVSNYKTSFFEKGMTIYSKYDISIELMEYTFYALVNGKSIENHETYNELYYGDSLENIKLYVKYNNGESEEVECSTKIDNVDYDLGDAIYNDCALCFKEISEQFKIDNNSNHLLIYIDPQPILFDYSISDDNVYIIANNYNGQINEVVFTVENDYLSDGTLEPHKKTLDSKIAMLDRHELITWAKGYDIKLNIYLPKNDDTENEEDINIDNMLYNSSLELDIYTSIDSFDFDYIYKTYIEVINRIEFKDGYYQIDDELKLLAFILEYEENYWISFDDGINSDPYFIANAQIHCVKITRDLYFDGFTINNHSDVYLYGYINGNNKTIYGLNFSNPYIYVENYGSIENITIKDTNLKNVFYYNSDYGYTSNVNVEEE